MESDNWQQNMLKGMQQKREARGGLAPSRFGSRAAENPPATNSAAAHAPGSSSNPSGAAAQPLDLSKLTSSELMMEGLKRARACREPAVQVQPASAPPPAPVIPSSTPEQRVNVVGKDGKLLTKKDFEELVASTIDEGFRKTAAR
jgi:hypothetical protein